MNVKKSFFKKSFFNFTVFKRAVYSVMPLIITGVIVAIFLFPMSMNSSLSRTQEYINKGIYIDKVLSDTAYNGICSRFSNGFILIYSFYAAICALIIFSYNYNKTKANAYHSLPINRKTLFFSHVTAGLFAIIVPFIVGFLGSAAVLASYVPNLIILLFKYVFSTLLICLLFFGIMVLCCQITGNQFFSLFLYGIINTGTVILYNIYNIYATEYYFGYESVIPKIIMRLSPSINLFNISSSLEYDIDKLNNINSLPEGFFVNSLTFAAAGIVILFIALFAYQKKHVETNGSCITLKPIRTIVAVIVSICFSFLFELLIFIILNISEPSKPIVSITFLIGGILGIIASTMAIYKSPRVWNEIRKNYIIYAIISIVMFLIVQFDITGRSKYQPDIDSIKYIYVQTPLGNILSDNKEDNKKLYDIYKIIADNKDYFIKLNNNWESAEVYSNDYYDFSDEDYYDSFPDTDSSNAISDTNMPVSESFGEYFRFAIQYYSDDETISIRNYDLYIPYSEAADLTTPAGQLLKAFADNYPVSQLLNNLENNFYYTNDYINGNLSTIYNSNLNENNYITAIDKLLYDKFISALKADYALGNIKLNYEDFLAYSYDRLTKNENIRYVLSLSGQMNIDILNNMYALYDLHRPWSNWKIIINKDCTNTIEFIESIKIPEEDNLYNF